MLSLIWRAWPLAIGLLAAACSSGQAPQAGPAGDRGNPAAGTDARQRVQQMIGGHIPSMLVSVTAKLRLADHLRDGPRSVAELAVATKTHEDSLYRVLRAVTELGVFVEEPARTFRLNEAAEFLRSDVPGSLRAAAEVSGEPWMRGPWGALLHSVQTGETAFNHMYGQGTFDFFAKNREAAVLFDAWQAAGTASGEEDSCLAVLGEKVECALAVHMVERRLPCLHAVEQRAPGSSHPRLPPLSLGGGPKRARHIRAQEFGSLSSVERCVRLLNEDPPSSVTARSTR